MKKVIFEVDNTSLNESLCDGLSKRIFREVKAYTAAGAMLTSMKYNGFDGVELNKRAINEITSGSNVRRMKKAVILEFITSQFLSTAFSSVHRICEDKTITFVDGIVVRGRMMYSMTLMRDHKKPHRSAIYGSNIGFTHHAISRLIRRIKPDDIVSVISIAATMCQIMLDGFFEREVFLDEKGCYWLPVYGLGYFLLTKDDYGYTVITFVDNAKLTNSQREAAEDVDQVFAQNVECWSEYKAYHDMLMKGMINKPKLVFGAYAPSWGR